MANLEKQNLLETFTNELRVKKNSFSKWIYPNIAADEKSIIDYFNKKVIQSDIQENSDATKKAIEESKKKKKNLYSKMFRGGFSFGATTGVKSNTCNNRIIFGMDVDNFGYLEAIDLLNTTEEIKTIFKSVMLSHANKNKKANYLGENYPEIYKQYLDIYNKISIELTQKYFDLLSKDDNVVYCELSKSKKGIHFLTYFEKPITGQHEKFYNYYKLVDHFSSKYGINFYYFEYIKVLTVQNNLLVFGKDHSFNFNAKPMPVETIDKVKFNKYYNYSKFRHNNNAIKGKTEIKNVPLKDTNDILDYNFNAVTNFEFDILSNFLHEFQFKNKKLEIFKNDSKEKIYARCLCCNEKATYNLFKSKIYYYCKDRSCNDKNKHKVEKIINEIFSKTNDYIYLKRFLPLKYILKKIFRNALIFSKRDNDTYTFSIKIDGALVFVCDYKNSFFEINDNYYSTIPDAAKKYYNKKIVDLNKLILSNMFNLEHKTVYYDKKVSDNKKEIKKIYSDNENYNIISGTGSGKTTAAAWYSLFNKVRTIVLMPNIPTVEQHALNFQSLAVIGGVTTQDIIDYLNGDLRYSNNCLIFSTYQSFFKFLKLDSEILSSFNLVIDEKHKEVCEHDIQVKAFNLIENNAHKFNKIVTMTGTPTLSNFNKSYKTIKFKKNGSETKKNENILSYNIVDKYDSYTDLVNHIVKNKIANQDKIQVLFLNNKDTIDIFYKLFIDSGYFKGNEIGIITKETKEEDIFKNIIEEEKIKDGISLIMATSVISDSINILNTNIDNIYYFRLENLILLEQFTARFREAKLNIYDYVSNNQNNENISYNLQESLDTDITRNVNIMNNLNKSVRINLSKIDKANLDFIENIFVEKGKKEFVEYNSDVKKWVVNYAELHLKHLLELGRFTLKNKEIRKQFVSYALNIDLKNIQYCKLLVANEKNQLCKRDKNYYIDNIDTIKKKNETMEILQHKIKKADIKKAFKDAKDKKNICKTVEIEKIINNKNELVKIVEDNLLLYRGDYKKLINDLFDKHDNFKDHYDLLLRFSKKMIGFNKMNLIKIIELSKFKIIDNDLVKQALELYNVKYNNLILALEYQSVKHIELELATDATDNNITKLAIDHFNQFKFLESELNNANNLYLFKDKNIINIKNVTSNFNSKFGTNFKSNKIINYLNAMFNLEHLRVKNSWYYYYGGKNSMDLINAKYFKTDKLKKLQPDFQKMVIQAAEKNNNSPKIGLFEGM